MASTSSRIRFPLLTCLAAAGGTALAHESLASMPLPGFAAGLLALVHGAAHSIDLAGPQPWPSLAGVLLGSVAMLFVGLRLVRRLALRRRAARLRHVVSIDLSGSP